MISFSCVVWRVNFCLTVAGLPQLCINLFVLTLCASKPKNDHAENFTRELAEGQLVNQNLWICLHNSRKSPAQLRMVPACLWKPIIYTSIICIGREIDRYALHPTYRNFPSFVFWKSLNAGQTVEGLFSSFQASWSSIGWLFVAYLGGGGVWVVVVVFWGEGVGFCCCLFAFLLQVINSAVCLVFCCCCLPASKVSSSSRLQIFWNASHLRWLLCLQDGSGRPVDSWYLLRFRPVFAGPAARITTVALTFFTAKFYISIVIRMAFSQN